MKKIISVVGARPNFMKVAPIHRAFEKYSAEVKHLIVHTGQHYDYKMSDAFFQDLKMPNPDHFLNVGSGSHANQTAKIMVEFEKVCMDEKPDLIIVVGDVNSTIACALTAKKLHIPVAHVEAGLRSHDMLMPEEVNRVATDAITDYYFVTEKSGRENLLKNGVDEDKIFFVGNTMIDSQHFAKPLVEQTTIKQELGLSKGEYVLVTIHRPSNVDIPEQLKSLLEVFKEFSGERKIIFPIHPRTRKNIEKFGFNEFTKSIDNLTLLEPLGYIDFLSLMMDADFILTDSGGIQEETTALGVPCLTMRTTTERPVTIEEGTNILIQPEANIIRREFKKIISGDKKAGRIPQLWDGKAADRIADILTKLV
jgi:UDP-N-acetylglucosamine 2-epimerase (non-hydrolysing)